MSKLKSYSKNVLKSFGFATSDIIDDKYSNMKYTFEYVGETSNDISKFIRNQKSSLQRLDTTFSKDILLNKGKAILKDAKDDILSGKFYDKYRSDDDFDWDDLDDFPDDDYMSDDNDDKRKVSNENIRSRILSKENKLNTHYLSKTLLSTTETLVESNKHNMSMLYSQNLALHSTLNKNLNAMTSNLTARIDNTNNLLKTQVDNAAKFYSESLTMQKQTNELLSKLVNAGSDADKYNSDRKGKRGMDKVLSFGMIDNKKYIKQIRKNFDTNVFDTSEIEQIWTLYKMAKNEGLLGGGIRNIADPLKSVPKLLMGGLFDKNTKKMLSDFNDTFQDIGRIFLRRMNKLKGSSNGFLSLLGDIFGVETNIDSKPSRDYFKGRTFWDGKSKKALEEVIPQYLSEIASALTHKDNMIYDYDRGDFVKLGDMKKNRLNDKKYYARRGQGTLSRDIDRLISKMDISYDAKKDIDARFEKLYMTLMDRDMVLDSKNFKKIVGDKDFGLNDEYMVTLISKALEKYDNGTTESNLNRINRRGVFESSKSRYVSSIQNPSSATLASYSKMFEDKNVIVSEGQTKLSGYGVLGGVDSYNMTIFDYLRDISTNIGRLKAGNKISGRSTTSRSRVGSSRTGRRTPARKYSRTGTISSQLDGEAVSSSTLNELAEALNAEDILDRDDYEEGWLAKKISKQFNIPVLNDVVQSAGLFTSKILQTVLVGDDSGNTSFVGALKDIFDNPNSVMGRFAKDLENYHRSTNTAMNMFYLILDRIKATEIYQKATSFGKSVWSDTKKYASNVFSSVGSAFASIKDDITGGWNSLRSRGYEERDKNEKKLIDQVRKGKVGRYAGGSGRMLDRDSIVAVSKGEMILTPAEAELYMSIVNKKHLTTATIAKGEVDDSVIDELVNSFNSRNKAPSFKKSAKKGGGFAKDVLDETIYGAGQVFQSLFDINPSDKTEAAKKLSSSIQKDVKSKLSKLVAGGALGAGASLLLGTIGGPLVGAAAGVGLSLVKESNAFRKFLFGDINGEEKGIIPGSVQHTIARYLPDMKKYGLAGGVLGMLPVAPFGPVGGIMIGSAISFAKNNQGIQEALFGVEGIFGKQAHDFLEKNHKRLLAGAAIGVMTGPFGLIGNALLGSGIGALTASTTFTEGLLGKKVNGRYVDGVLPTIRDTVVAPLIEFAKAGPNKLAEFAKEEIFKPLKSAFDPLKEAISNMGRSLNRTFKSVMSSVFEKAVATPLYKSLEDKIINPLKSQIQRVFGIATGVVKRVVTTPFKVVGGLGNRLRDKQIRGGNAAYMTAKERLAYSAMRGLDIDEGLVNMDTKLAGMNLAELDGIRKQMYSVALVNSGKSDRFKGSSSKAYKEIMRLSNNKLKAQDTIKIGKAIDKDMPSSALKGLVQSIAYRRGLNDEETNGVVEFVLSHQKDIRTIKSGDVTKKNNMNKTIAKQLGLGEGWEKKYNASDLYRRIDKEFRSSIKYDEEGKIHAVTPSDRAMEAIKKVADNTPKYRDGVLGKLDRLIEWAAYKVTGHIPKGYETMITNVRYPRLHAVSDDHIQYDILTSASDAQMGKRINNMAKGWNAFDMTKNIFGKNGQILYANAVRMGLASPTAFSHKDVMEASLDPSQNIDEEAASYENTPDGMIKYITNAHGAKEIDVSDSTTATTLAKKKKREKEEAKVREAQSQIDTNKSDKSDGKDDKKNGLLSKLAGIPGMLLGKAKGILGGMGSFMGGGIGRALFGLGGSIGLIGLLAAAPYLNKTVVPYVQKNFDTQILPFVTSQVVPGTMALITSLAPYIIRLGVEGVKTAITSLLSNGGRFLNGVNNLAGDSLVAASGGQLDQAMTIDENGNVVRLSGSQANASHIGTDLGQTTIRNTITGGQLVKNSRNVGVYSGAVARKLGLDRVAGSKAGKWLGKTNAGRAGKFLAGSARTVANVPNALLNGKPGQRLNILKESMSNAKSTYRNGALKKFGDILKDEKVSSRLASDMLYSETGKGSILGRVKDQLYRGIEKMINLPFIKNRLGAEMVERLTNGGIGAIVEKFGKEIASKSLVQSAGKTGIGKAVGKGVARAATGIGTMGVATIAFAAYDIYDGWTKAYKYFGLTEEEQDEIPTGMKFVSALIVMTKNLFLGTAIIPAEFFVNLYKTIVCKIFGEESMFKMKELEKKANRRVAEYNKKHKTNYTKAEYNKKISDEKFARTWYGKAWNAVVEPLKKLLGGGKALTGKARANDIVSRYKIGGLGYGPDESVSPTSSKIIPKTSGMSHYYSQSDPKWGNNRLGDSNMSKAGCGPTSIAMALSNATGRNITPDKIARDNKENLPGYSTWGLFPSVAEKYGLGMSRVSPNAQDLANNLRHGEVILSGVRQTGDTNRTPFTNAGHIVVAKGIKNGKVEIADPRGGKYNRSYDLQDVLNETTVGFRYDTNGANLDGVGNRYGNAGGADDKLGDKVVAFAKRIKDKVKYVYGGNTFNENGISTDCSGFTKFVYKQAANIDLPRSSGDQGRQGKGISLSEAKAGDLAAYSGHVGIIINDKGDVIHNSAPGVNVIYGKAKTSGRGLNVRRVLPDDQIGVGSEVNSDTASSSSNTSKSTISGITSSGDPLGTIFGGIGNAFMKAGADLFGIKMETQAASNANASGGTSSESSSGFTPTADGSGQGLHKRIDRKEDIPAAVYEAYLRKMGADPAFTGAAVKEAAEKSGLAGSDIMVWAALEANWGKSRIRRAYNNWFGIGAYDSNPDNSKKYKHPTPAAGLVAGAKWIAKNYVYHPKYLQNTFNKVFNDTPPNHDYSTDNQEAAKLAGMRDKFLKFAASYSAGKGPEESFKDAYGYKPTTKELNGLVGMVHASLGGAPEEGSGSKSGNPNQLHGFPYYSQCDKEFNKPGFNTMWTGCGPTAAAMVATAATKRRVTPLETGAKAKAKGLWNGNNASSHAIFPSLGKDFGYTATQNASNKEFFDNASKRIVQFAVGTGRSPYTSSGHYIVVLGEKDGKIVTNNPISTKTSGAFPKSVYSVTRKSWAVSVGGKPLVWDGQGYAISGENPSAPSMDEGGAQQVPPEHQETGADPLGTVFGGIGNAFMKAGADLFGIGSESSSTTKTDDNAGTGLDRFFGKTLGAKISSPFGRRKVAGYGNYHTGVDYDTNGKRKTLFSPIAGRVTSKSTSSGKGKSLQITDMYGNTHHFDHLTSAGVGVGDYVGEQDILGKIGDSGNAMGKHLHYEVTNRKNESMDPRDYMDKYGAFGGVQNQRIAGVTDMTFSKPKETTKPTSTGNSIDRKVFLMIMTKVLELLGNISNSNTSSSQTLISIMNVLAKYSDKLPPEAKKELSAIDNINEVLAGMVNADKMAMAKGRNRESKLINSDIREVTDIMKQLAYE